MVASAASSGDPDVPTSAGVQPPSAEGSKPAPAVEAIGVTPLVDPGPRPADARGSGASAQQGISARARAPLPPSLRERLAAKARPVQGLAPKRRFDLALGGGQSFVLDDSIDNFNAYGEFGNFWAQARLEFGIGQSRRLSLGPVLGWSRFSGWGYPSSPSFSDFEDEYEYDSEASVKVDDLTAGLRASLVTIEGIDVFAELRGGMSVVELDVHLPAPDAESSFDRVLGHAAAGVGLSLYLPRKWLPRKGASHWNAGIELQAVYDLRGAIDLQIQARRDDEGNLPDDHIETTYPNLGTLELQGLSWRGGVFMRFM